MEVCVVWNHHVFIGLTNGIRQVRFGGSITVLAGAPGQARTVWGCLGRDMALVAWDLVVGMRKLDGVIEGTIVVV
jgi:hypothetical protein